MKSKITDMSNFKDNPQKRYQTVVQEIEEYIEEYSSPIEKKDLTRIIPDEEITKEEKEIAEEVGKEITKICQKYKGKEINIEGISKLTGELLYSQYSPHILYRILNRDLYDFLEKASEYDFYTAKLEELHHNITSSSQTSPSTH